MRWPVFVILAYLALVLETGLKGMLHIGGATPSLLLILLVYVGISAPPLTVLWAGAALGLLHDLSAAVPATGAPLHVVGPGVLGFMLAGYATLQIRALVFRNSSITVAMAVFFAGILAHLLIVALLTFRGLPIVPGQAIEGWRAADQLVSRFLSLLYTTIVALPLGRLLLWTDPWWGFTTLTSRRGR
jgi:rod shape-determining protein MreD